jgi:hypothetical protein
MKWLVWLLLLVNVALLGYFQLGLQSQIEPVSGHDAINSDRLKAVTPDELAKMTPKQETAPLPKPEIPPPVAMCYEWGSFAGPDVARAKTELDKLSLEAIARERTPQDAVRYWVYIPPRKSREEAQTKVDELKSLGVEEIFIVQEPKWLFAISLGVFKEEALANKLLQDLQNRGVKTAVKGRRNHEGGQTSYFVKNASSIQVDEIGKLRPDFPGSELKQVSCQ